MAHVRHDLHYCMELCVRGSTRSCARWNLHGRSCTLDPSCDLGTAQQVTSPHLIRQCNCRSYSGPVLASERPTSSFKSASFCWILSVSSWLALKCSPGCRHKLPLHKRTTWSNVAWSHLQCALRSNSEVESAGENQGFWTRPSRCIRPASRHGRHCEGKHLTATHLFGQIHLDMYLF